MEFLYMADDMMDPSFLDASDSDLAWTSGWANEGGTGTRKRKAAEGLHSEPSKSGDYRLNGIPPLKHARNKNIGICQDRVNTSWQQVDDLTNNLSDDLDGSCSLTGLGVDLNSTSYNISDALLTLPSLTVFKQELPSPGNNQENGNLFGNNHMSPFSSNNVVDSPHSISSHAGECSASNSPPHLHQMLKPNYGTEQKEKDSIPVCLVIPENHQLTNGNSSGSPATNSTITGDNKLSIVQEEQGNEISSKNNGGTFSSPSSSASSPCSSEPLVHTEDCRFQYVLAAATSIATKVNEETQTYLNQGQSYEIKLKKLGDLSDYRGKILKSVVRLSFHERRLQYMEGEQMAAWVASHPSQRILEVDLPLSYGIIDVLQDHSLLNTVEFLWDPTKEVGVYIKVNCISTEFTPNKHGGEKGVPFRIQVETYLQNQNVNRRLHAASCQVKVFKLKGADRKHKQDREKILKRPISEQDKYQPSYDCTVLNDMPVINEPLFPACSSTQAVVVAPIKVSPSTAEKNCVNNLPKNAAVTFEPLNEDGKIKSISTNCSVPAIEPPPNNQGSNQQGFDSNCETSLSSNATVQQAAAWLQHNRFSAFLRTFANFSGLDLLRLSCDNLVQICGLPEGMRMFNALHKTSRLTLYLCVEANMEVYHALYLATLTNTEIRAKLAVMLGISVAQIEDVFIQGRNGIHIIISDDVVRNFKDEATYVIEIMQGHNVEGYSLLLKPSIRCAS